MATLSTLPAHARAHLASSRHGEAWARDHFAAAERMREALNGRLPAERTRRDYQRVINAYRSVYYGAPTSTKADPSVVSVAETLVEMGRRFDDDRILKDAIAQYKFLRREYPGSKYRCDALFTIGEIYNDDLNDPEQARATFQDFLHRYPHNRLVEDAQQAIADIDKQAAADKNAATEKDKSKQAADKRKSVPASIDKTDNLHAPAAQAAEPDGERNSGTLPRVTGIRHWSTPDYTRVAIDLESEVKFGSSRIGNPDRIFFDLRDTKLASTLVGKSFDVDDGFLKKIRVAQFKPGRTRVVLEVDNLSDYDAFLLPNPYRLIVDIHGKEYSKNSRKSPPKDLDASTDLQPSSDDGSKTEATAETKAAPEKNTSPSEDLRAHAGKAPVPRQDVGDDAKVDQKDLANSKTYAAIHGAQVAASPKRETAAVTKVIVDADDDDDTPPVKTANEHATPKATSHKNKNDKLAESEVPADDKSESRRSTSHQTTRSRKSAAIVNKKNKEDAADSDIREASPTASGDRSLIRALGLKIGKIVIDPGHGGHDAGTVGPNGLEEKDLVLEVGRRLGKLLETRLGAEVVYTRKNDTFIPLETRTAIANQQRADLFISIHANSSQDPDARGVETYYLNFTSSPEALEVAARENAVSEKSIYELQDLVKKIALKEKIDESREFAADVQESLHNGLATKSSGIRNRGVKKAPFIVLIGANMPSILAEISFVSNPGDERRLETSEYRQRIAESLYRGIAKYVNGLSGVKVASKLERTAGQ
jgi:N-acetylmuramoyl-L-alanine amidase